MRMLPLSENGALPLLGRMITAVSPVSGRKKLASSVILLIAGCAALAFYGAGNSPTFRLLTAISSVADRKAIAAGLRHQCIGQVRRQQLGVLSDIFGGEAKQKWGDKVLLVDPAYHPNVGDHMLAVGELEFLSSLGWHEKNVYQCDVVQGSGMVEKCGDFTKYRNDGVKLALWHAGGNWGDLWPHVQKGRIGTFRRLLELGFTIVGMPQSLHYRFPEKTIQDMYALRNEIVAGLGLRDESALVGVKGMELARSRIILTWRERESLEEAQKLYPFVQHRLVPDIAFNLGPYIPHDIALSTISVSLRESTQKQKFLGPEKVDLLLFVRKDYESVIKKDARSREYVQSYLNSLPEGRGRGLTFRIVDWDDRKALFKDDYRFFSQTSVDLLASGRVVVADRLHASILSFLSNRPFIFVDQMTKKISRTLGVAMESWDGCKDEESLMYGSAETLEQGIDKAIYFLDLYDLRGDEV